MFFVAMFFVTTFGFVTILYTIVSLRFEVSAPKTCTVYLPLPSTSKAKALRELLLENCQILLRNYGPEGMYRTPHVRFRFERIPFALEGLVAVALRVKSRRKCTCTE